MNRLMMLFSASVLMFCLTSCGSYVKKADYEESQRQVQDLKKQLAAAKDDHNQAQNSGQALKPKATHGGDDKVPIPPSKPPQDSDDNPVNRANDNPAIRVVHNSGDNPPRQPSADTNPPAGGAPPDKPPTRGVIDWVFDLSSEIPIAAGISIFTLTLLEILLRRKKEVRQQIQQEEKLDKLEKKVESEPEKVKPVWELARFTLENYFQRNLAQVKAIYTVSIMVMAAGFGVILWGILIAASDPNRVKIGLIASASGIITEFISLTFMVIYRLTMAQANEYVAVLERINTVGMTIQILDSMADGATDLKDSTRADIIRILLNTTSAKGSPDSRRKKQTRKRIQGAAG